MRRDAATPFRGIPLTHVCLPLQATILKSECEFKQHEESGNEVNEASRWSNEDPRLKSSKGSRQSNGSQRESNGW